MPTGTRECRSRHLDQVHLREELDLCAEEVAGVGCRGVGLQADGDVGVR